MARRARRTKAEIEDARRDIEEKAVVLWATTHGAPVRILEGWNPQTGKWVITSPVGAMLALVQAANFPSVAARIAGVSDLTGLLAKGNEFAVEAAEERAFIPIDVLPFIDLVREMEVAEAASEIDMVKVVTKGAKNDPKLALAFLSRRYGARWREQQSIFTSEDVDERDKAVSMALSDPNTALQLAEVAHRIEDNAPREE